MKMEFGNESVRQNLPIITKLPELGSQQYYETLTPHAKWEVTDQVEPGEIGPGCHLKCAFCNQQSFDTNESNEKLASYVSLTIDGGVSLNSRLMVGRKIERQIDAGTLIEEYVSRPYYSKDNWVLLENFNDPGTNWGKTSQIAELLLSEGHEGPVTMITKMGIPDKYAKKFGELRQAGLHLNTVVSYSGLPLAIEPAPVLPRIETLRKMREQDIPTIVSIRPLIKGINLNDQTIREVVENTKDFTDVYIAGGLFVFDDWTPKVFEDLGYPLDPLYLDVNYTSAKVVEEVLYKRVERVAKESGFDVRVMAHTTCAVARNMTVHYGIPTADRISHWVDHSDFPKNFQDCSTCPIEQKSVCESVDRNAGIPSAIDALGKIGISADVTLSETHDGYALVHDNSLSYGELSLAREASGLYVNNLPTQNQISKIVDSVLRDTITEGGEGIEPKYFKVGEEWMIVLPPNSDGKNNRHLEKVVRSKSLARIKIVSADILDDATLIGTSEKLFASTSLREQFISGYRSLDTEQK